VQYVKVQSALSRTMAAERAKLIRARQATKGELQAAADRLAAEMRDRLAAEAEQIIAGAVADMGSLNSRFARLARAVQETEDASGSPGPQRQSIREAPRRRSSDDL
jgi:hypothetical protein